ncbi:hypothetical protein Droror1_Dr00027798 [Drosera rotundifolia]
MPLNFLPNHRTSRSEFLVSVNKYLEAKNNKLSVGMRFKMRFEGEEVPERRFSGTIVGVSDTDSSGWANSEWRSLKVQWDEPSSIFRPDRVSPWELEPLEPAGTPNSHPAQRCKRPRPSAISSSVPDAPVLGVLKPVLESAPALYPDVHAQDQNLSPKLSSTMLVNSLSFSQNSSLLMSPGHSMYWPSRAGNVSGSVDTLVNEEPSEKRQRSGTGCRLFGVQLIDHSAIDDTGGEASAPAKTVEEQPFPTLDVGSGSLSEPSNVNQSDVPSVSCEPEKSSIRSALEPSSKQSRTCTKVHMQGQAVGRAVDLSRLNCYEDLLKKLEAMFGIKGELCGSENKWEVVYTDDEDDMMMVGDDPWHEFCSMVRKIFVYTVEEVKRLSPKTKLPVSEEAKPCKLDFEQTAGSEDQSSTIGPSSS